MTTADLRRCGWANGVLPSGDERSQHKMKKNPKVLVVDDDKDFCQTLCQIISSSGYECIMAYDGTSGIEIAESARPDVIVLDIKLSAEDGFTVYKRLRLLAQTRDVPIILISGYYDGEVKDGLLFIRKPFHPDVLIGHLSDIVGRKKAKVGEKPLRVKLSRPPVGEAAADDQGLESFFDISW